MAVRTANFISAFLQVVNPSEVFPGTRIVDKPLNEDQMIGESLAMVMGNTKIWSAGIYFDANQFTNRTYFAPFAYKKEQPQEQDRVQGSCGRVHGYQEAGY